MNASTTPRCLQLNVDDNVAVVLDDAVPGAIVVMGSSAGVTVSATESIASGHKIAVRPIGQGEAVVKYGVAIGAATRPIAAGAWVHTHNCRSSLDERSHTLDPHTGTPTDTKYV